jgi:hypothetical protein
MKAMLLLALLGCGESSEATPDAPAFDPSQWQASITATVRELRVSNTSSALMLEIDAMFGAPGAVWPDGIDVSATFRGTTASLSTESGGKYHAVLPLDGMPADGQTVSVTLTDGQTTATSTATIPDGFELVSHTGMWPNFDVTWSPTSSDPFAWQLFIAAIGGHDPANCSFSPTNGDLPDTGTASVHLPNASGAGAFCDARTSLVRSRAGTVAPELAGGTVTARQVRDLD